MNRVCRLVEGLAVFGISLLAIPIAIGQEKPAQSLDDPLPKGAIQRLGSTRLRLGLALTPFVGFDANGDIVTTENDEFSIWSSRDGRELKRIDQLRKLSSRIAGARLSADGKRLFACDGLELVGWDLEKSSELFRLPCPCEHALQGASMARTADNRVICLSGEEGLSVVDTMKNPPVARKLGMKLKSDSKSMAVTPDGKTAAILDGAKIIFIDLANLKIAREWTHGEVGVRNMIFLDNGRLAFLVAGSEKAIGKLGVFDLKLGAAVTQEAATGYFQAMAISADGKLLAFGDASDKVEILQTSDLSLVKTFESPITAMGLAFSRDGKSLAAVDGSVVRVLDMATGADRIPTPGHRSMITSIVFSNPGDTIYSSAGQTVIAWDCKSGAIEHEITDFAPHQIVTVHLVRNWLLTISTDGSLKYWNAKSLQPIGMLCKRPTRVIADAVSADGKRFAVAENPGQVSLAKIDDPENAQVFECGKDLVTKLALSPDGKYLAAQSLDKSTYVVDIGTGKVIKSRPPGERSTFSPIAFHPDGRLLTVISDRSGTGLYDVLNTRVIENLNLPLGVALLSFSRDGRLLSTGDIDGTIQIWDFKEKKVLATFKGHRGGVTCLRFSPDGSILASGGQDTTILLWKAPKLK